MTKWTISYTVESTGQSDTFTVENGSMSVPTAKRYTMNRLLQMSDVPPDAFTEDDITVSYDPDIDDFPFG